jgi:hypothetical protein
MIPTAIEREPIVRIGGKTTTPYLSHGASYMKWYELFRYLY